MRRASVDPTLLDAAKVIHTHLRACRNNLEVTYLVRMFAVFEEALRDVRRLVSYQRPCHRALLTEFQSKRFGISQNDFG